MKDLFLTDDNVSECEIEFDDDVVFIRIPTTDAWTAHDIKQLRKFLKKIQKQLEGKGRGEVAMDDSDTLFTANGAECEVDFCDGCGGVHIDIPNAYIWESSDVKELRKFLKKVQRELELRESLK